MKTKSALGVIGLAVSVVLWTSACGGVDDGLTAVDEDALSSESGPQADAQEPVEEETSEFCIEQCDGKSWWDGENRRTVGPVQQGAPVQVGASTFIPGSMLHLALVTNPTSSPAKFSPATTTCTTNSGTATLSSSNNATLTSGINIGGLNLGGSGTIASTTGTSQTVTTCKSVGASLTYTILPREVLYCTVFDGMVRMEFDVPRFEIASSYYWYRQCHKCRTTAIHLCGGDVCGPWQQGTGTETKVALDPIHVVLQIPIAGTKCSSTAYPLSPF